MDIDGSGMEMMLKLAVLQQTDPAVYRLKMQSLKIVIKDFYNIMSELQKELNE